MTKDLPIKHTPFKSCELDPIPTEILKEIIPQHSPLITAQVNSSLEMGIFPSSLKEAFLRLLLKKPNLELTKKNYRPVSNLAYIG